MAQCEPCIQKKKVKRKKMRGGDGEVCMRGKKKFRERSFSFSLRFTTIGL